LLDSTGNTGIPRQSVSATRTAVIVIPTSNEAESIGILLDELISRVFPATTWDCHALVVDANSPDRTAEVVRRIQKRSGKVHLIVEQKKEGLGAAYFKGFRYAMDDLSAGALSKSR
jgi:dolichol-phosphate mannosyltransferase